MGAPVRSAGTQFGAVPRTRGQVSLGCRRFQIGPAWLTRDNEAAEVRDGVAAVLSEQQRVGQGADRRGLGDGGAGQADLGGEDAAGGSEVDGRRAKGRRRECRLSWRRPAIGESDSGSGLRRKAVLISAAPENKRCRRSEWVPPALAWSRATPGEFDLRVRAPVVRAWAISVPGERDLRRVRLPARAWRWQMPARRDGGGIGAGAGCVGGGVGSQAGCADGEENDGASEVR